MTIKILLPLAAAIGLTACASHEPKDVAFYPPSATITVSDRDHLDEADKRADEFCDRYGLRAERDEVVSGYQDVTVYYKCR